MTQVTISGRENKHDDFLNVLLTVFGALAKQDPVQLWCMVRNVSTQSKWQYLYFFHSKSQMKSTEHFPIMNLLAMRSFFLWYGNNASIKDRHPHWERNKHSCFVFKLYWHFPIHQLIPVTINDKLHLLKQQQNECYFISFVLCTGSWLCK